MAFLRSSPEKFGRSSAFNMLKTLRENGCIQRVRRGHYAVSHKINYTYNLSDTAKDIVTAIQSGYPLVTFQIWELYQMNEFVNHQIAKNTIFLDIENMQEETVFNLIFSEYPHVLLNPGIDDYYRYSGDETIVVEKLITESPAAVGDYNQCPLEKLLVDLFGRNIAGSVISRSEYPAIYEDSFRKYNINFQKMLRYARRRGVEQKIKRFIDEETEIDLETLYDR
ncbi:MAG: hypothetical protein J6X34_10560 [Clostridia bacterium]|nr:hypothetical protein [Clostridia bacterium]MBP5781656.1 hypothetical protein [Clostridia bacterium]